MLRSRACFCSHLCDCLQTLSNSELASRLIASQEEADAALLAMRTSQFLVARAEVFRLWRSARVPLEVHRGLRGSRPLDISECGCGLLKPGPLWDGRAGVAAFISQSQCLFARGTHYCCVVCP